MQIHYFFLLSFFYSTYSGCSAPTRRDTPPVSYLPYFSLDESVKLLPKTSGDVDICSNPIQIPGGLPIGSIRAPNISVCENGVILTEPTLLRSFLCVCRGEFKTCEDPGESVYAIAPFWSNVNDVLATQNTSISYQTFEERNRLHTEMFEHVWSYIFGMIVEETIQIQFFPTWMLVAHWKNVHPYRNPNEIDPRTNTFQAIIATDGTQTYAIFTYNCSDLGWANGNTYLAYDCSFIGNYIGGSFADYLSQTGLQITTRMANISKAASCSNPTTWNNFLFNLTPQLVANITARQETIAAIIGDSVTIQFYISTLIYQSFLIKLSFVPECQCSMVTPPHSIVCDGVEESITIAGLNIMTVCFAGRLNVTVTNVTEEALGEYTASITVDATVSDTAISNLKLGDVVASEDLLLKTSDPSQLTSDDIASASADLQDLETAAISNENVRQNYLKTIDNLMQADASSLIQSQIENSSSSRILDSLQQFTLNVELPANITNETYIYETYGIQIFDINAMTFTERDVGANLGPAEVVKNVTIPVNISFSDDIDQEGLAMYVEIRDSMENEHETYRLSVVVYRQENLFQIDTTNGTGVNITSAIMSVSGKTNGRPTFTMGFRSLVENEGSEVVNSGETVQEVCSSFNTGGNGGRGAWSGENCEEVRCTTSDSDYTCCECHTYGHFGLLLAVTPVVLDRNFEVVLVVFSYIGAGISILCLTILLITYILAKKLRHSTNGKLLINLSISLLGIYIFFVVGGHIRPYGDTYAVDIACAISSAILHYFMLVYFGWTAAEALNLYFSLVEVLEARSIRHYTLKAGLVVWVVPLVIVGISAGAGHTFYINDVYCRPVEWPFYFAFLFPIAIILLFDCVIFMRIMLVLYKHTKKTEERNARKKGQRIREIKRNTKYAIGLVTLFGLGWIFGLVVTGYPEAPMAVTFSLQFGFCLFVSAQGVLLFVFQFLLSRIARDFWLSKLERCLPCIKRYRISDSKKAKQHYKKKTIMKRVTGLFKTPKPDHIMESPDHTFSTMGRSGHLSSGITESFEASYHTATLPRPTTAARQTSPHHSTVGSTENAAREMMSRETEFNIPDIDFDNLSLQDDF